jgi:hypothetical protein
MGLELDWLEREERYRRRVLRLMIIGIVLVGGTIAVLGYLGGQRKQASIAAAGREAVAAREAEAKRARELFVADSTAAANRYNGFVQRHGALVLETLPLLQVPLPRGQSTAAFGRSLWSEYVRVADPKVTPEQEVDWYRQYYVDLMNDGPLRGTAALLPTMKQSGTSFVLDKPSFSDITQGQVLVGMRQQVVEVPVDSLAAPIVAEPPPATNEAPPAQQPPAQPEPAPEPAPAPPDTPAAPPDTSKPAPTDTVPKP